MFNICCSVHKVKNNREIVPKAIEHYLLKIVWFMITIQDKKKNYIQILIQEVLERRQFSQNSLVHDYDTRQKEELHPNIDNLSSRPNFLESTPPKN